VGLLATSLARQFDETAEAREKVIVDKGVVSSRDASIGSVAKAFIDAIAQHRHWEREDSRQ
jgi:hypothetical protein